MSREGTEPSTRRLGVTSPLSTAYPRVIFPQRIRKVWPPSVHGTPSFLARQGVPTGVLPEPFATPAGAPQRGVHPPVRVRGGRHDSPPRQCPLPVGEVGVRFLTSTL